jgi:hypothetical protein
MVTSIDTKKEKRQVADGQTMLGWSELSVHCRILAETVLVNFGCGLAVTLCTYNCTSEVYNYLISVVDVVLRVGECGLLVR